VESEEPFYGKTPTKNIETYGGGFDKLYCDDDLRVVVYTYIDRQRPLVYRDASSFFSHNDTPFHDASLKRNSEPNPPP